MSDTPETEAFQKTEYCAYDSMWRKFAQKLERERDEARQHIINLEVSLTAAIRSANVRQDETEKAIAQHDEARSELAYRLERNNVQQLQLSELRKQLAEIINKKY